MKIYHFFLVFIRVYEVNALMDITTPSRRKLFELCLHGASYDVTPHGVLQVGLSVYPNHGCTIDAKTACTKIPRERIYLKKHHVGIRRIRSAYLV